MDFELHISSPSALYGNPGVNPSKISSDFSGLSLLARIWMWLSQMWGHESCPVTAAESVFCLGVDDALNGHIYQNLISADGLGRRERRMLSRYDRLGLSYAQAKAWMKARIKRQKFQTALLRYYGLRFFRCAALMFSRTMQRELSRGELCHAPLCPD